MSYTVENVCVCMYSISRMTFTTLCKICVFLKSETKHNLNDLRVCSWGQALADHGDRIPENPTTSRDELGCDR